MLKFSAFYLDKQKSFIPKKIWSVPSLQDSSLFNLETVNISSSTHRWRIVSQLS